MEDLISKLADILEEDNLDTSKPFKAYENWDSLTALTIISIANSDYKKVIKTQDILSYPSIEEFCKAMLS